MPQFSRITGSSEASVSASNASATLLAGFLDETGTYYYFGDNSAGTVNRLTVSDWTMTELYGGGFTGSSQGVPIFPSFDGATFYAYRTTGTGAGNVYRLNRDGSTGALPTATRTGGFAPTTSGFVQADWSRSILIAGHGNGYVMGFAESAVATVDFSTADTTGATVWATPGMNCVWAAPSHRDSPDVLLLGGADNASTSRRLMRFDRRTWQAETLVGRVASSAGSGGTGSPYTISLGLVPQAVGDPDGRVYYRDGAAGRVRCLDTDGVVYDVCAGHVLAWLPTNKLLVRGLTNNRTAERIG